MATERAAVRAVIQAGGRGSRMSDAAVDCPKPLVEVGGVAMLERLARRIGHAGISQLTIVTGWQADQVEEHVRGWRDLPEGLEVKCFREAVPRGNIGALANIPRDDRAVLLAFGDLITDLDFGAFHDLHRKRGSDVTLTSHHEGYRLRLGELSVDGDRVTDYREKPEKQFLICSGIALFEPHVLDLVPRDRPSGISDLIGSAIASGLRVTHWEHGAFWRDVNSPAELVEAETSWNAR